MDYPVPTSDEYRQALSHLVLTPNQMTLLLTHFRAPAHTATAKELVKAAGTKTLQGFNLQYGRLADRLAQVLNRPAGIANLLWIAIAPGERGNEEWLYALRSEVVDAIKSLGWAKKRNRRR
jgi:hypothetical protein